jgi:hypothetical protein
MMKSNPLLQLSCLLAVGLMAAGLSAQGAPMHDRSAARTGGYQDRQGVNTDYKLNRQLGMASASTTWDKLHGTQSLSPAPNTLMRPGEQGLHQPTSPLGKGKTPYAPLTPPSTTPAADTPTNDASKTNANADGSHLPDNGTPNTDAGKSATTDKTAPATGADSSSTTAPSSATSPAPTTPPTPPVDTAVKSPATMPVPTVPATPATK